MDEFQKSVMINTLISRADSMTDVEFTEYFNYMFTWKSKEMSDRKIIQQALIDLNNEVYNIPNIAVWITKYKEGMPNGRVSISDIKRNLTSILSK